MKTTKFFSLCLLLICAGCATTPSRETLARHTINGVSYVALDALCASRQIPLEFDSFARTATVRHQGHVLQLMLEESLILQDGSPQRLSHPVEFRDGMIMVPYKFKEEIFDSLFRETSLTKKEVVPPAGLRTIVIDAGHGGNDPGAISRTGLHEKDVTLDIAKRLAALLRSAGFEVALTRSTDIFIPLSERVDIAKRQNVDLFLSIHANANRQRQMRGFEVYYISPTANDAERALTAAENDTLPFKGSSFASGSPVVKAILWDMLYASSRAQSMGLARSLCRAAKSNLDAQVLGIKAARYAVLRGSNTPAVLIEVGFLSNTNEEHLLKSSYYRQQLAETIAQGVKMYVSGCTLVGMKR